MSSLPLSGNASSSLSLENSTCSNVADTCRKIKTRNEKDCNSTAKVGYYCTHEVSSNHTLITTIEDLHFDSSKEIKCTNETKRVFCPVGHFCPSQYSIETCQPGGYCYHGSNRPTPCLFGAVTCPRRGMGGIDPLRAFGGLVLIIFTCLLTYKYVSHKFIFWAEVRYDLEHKREAGKKGREDEDEKKYSRALLFLNRMRVVEEEKARRLQGARSPQQRDSAQPDQSLARLNGPRLFARDSVFGPSKRSLPQPEQRRHRLRDVIRSDAFHDYMAALKAQSETFKASPVGEFSFKGVAEPLTIQFDHLNLNLKANDVPILQNVFGTFRPFNITALMGSSGAGKTTLLSLLRGQAHFARTSGNMFVNGERVESLVPFRDRMAFVPQDDIVYEELSVMDNILYSAMLFNKRGYRTEDECLPMVIHVIGLLGISHITHSVVGSAEKKGISGGQKKRVSVAVELVKEADIFLLDEPTSGLDAATSVSLLHSLHHISANGVNIVATLHQPRQEILEMINSICLLAPGGRVIFFGNPHQLALRFSQLGYQLPQGKVNMADYAMDAIAGFVKPVWCRHSAVQPSLSELMEKMWRLYELIDYPQFELQAAELRRQCAEQPGAFTRESIAKENDAIMQRAKAPKSYTNLPWLDLLVSKFFDKNFATLVVAFRRQLKGTHRTFSVTIAASCILVVLGVLIAMVFGSMSLDPDFELSDFASQTAAAQLAFGLILVSASLRLFLFDAHVRLREETGGVLLTPLFAGKILGSGIEFLCFAPAFLAGYYPFVASHATLAQYLAIYMLLHLAISAEANLLAILFPGKQTTLIASGVIIVLWSVGGISPTTLSIKDELGFLGEVLMAISPFSASFRLQVMVEFNAYSGSWGESIEVFYKQFGYRSYQLRQSYSSLTLHWFVCNMLAYIALILKRDNGKKVDDLLEALGVRSLQRAAPAMAARALHAAGSPFVTIDDRLNQRLNRIAKAAKKASRRHLVADEAACADNAFDLFPVYEVYDSDLFEDDDSRKRKMVINPLRGAKTGLMQMV